MQQPAVHVILLNINGTKLEFFCSVFNFLVCNHVSVAEWGTLLFTGSHIQRQSVANVAVAQAAKSPPFAGWAAWCPGEKLVADLNELFLLQPAQLQRSVLGWIARVGGQFAAGFCDGLRR